MIHKRSTALERSVDKESRSYTTGYVHQSSSDLKCFAGHRGYPGKGIMEDDCIHTIMRIGINRTLK